LKEQVDFYEILGVSKDASREEIKKAYRNLAKKAHPDQDGSEEEFKILSAAYETLYDPIKRESYDTYGVDEGKMKELMRCAIDMFKKAVSQDPLNIMETITSQNKEISYVGQSRKEDLEKKISNFEKYLSRIKHAPKNNFLEKALNIEIESFKIQIHGIEEQLQLFVDAEKMLLDYVFDVKREEPVYRLHTPGYTGETMSDILERFNM